MTSDPPEKKHHGWTQIAVVVLAWGTPVVSGAILFGSMKQEQNNHTETIAEHSREIQALQTNQSANEKITQLTAQIARLEQRVEDLVLELHRDRRGEMR